VPKPVLELLRATDQKLEQKVRCASLCPGRARATPLEALGRSLLGPSVELGIAHAFAGGLSRIALAVQRNFPGNLFWDLDYLAEGLLGAAASGLEGDPAGAIEARADLVVALQDLFSHRSGIQFRYAHDFLYGFDWAKWVAREPEARGAVRPFDEVFLRGMHQRGSELLELIARNSERYPQLEPGHDRNPFGFSREPAAEELLHRTLAAEQLLPLEAWSRSAKPDWERPYADLRKERAKALSL
jgi:hypothetical protein